MPKTLHPIADPINGLDVLKGVRVSGAQNNGRSLGRRSATGVAGGGHLRYPPVVFDVPWFEPGVLKTVGWLDRRTVARHRVATSGRSACLSLRAELWWWARCACAAKQACVWAGHHRREARSWSTHDLA